MFTDWSNLRRLDQSHYQKVNTMTSIQIALICATCSHDWVQNLDEIDNFRVAIRGERQVKVYRVPCPICGSAVMVEVDAGPDDVPSAWGS